jgi:hypothetical protein
MSKVITSKRARNISTDIIDYIINFSPIEINVVDDFYLLTRSFDWRIRSTSDNDEIFELHTYLGKPHRDSYDKPALISNKGSVKAWYKFGKLHRENGPAIITYVKIKGEYKLHFGYWFEEGIFKRQKCYDILERDESESESDWDRYDPNDDEGYVLSEISESDELEDSEFN